ncbi:chemotaxis protein CheW [Deinococcus planocerae]|uniref:chemotaxis protein CheW n=1 Tax=Deinococcus planocerae TaxID=1737569 RepID=UPI000C7F0556|nr:chemotaxis protein CheW [Deinococcus planocerae]
MQGRRVLLFRLGERVFAVPADHSREAFEPGRLAALPLSRRVLLGVCAVQGRPVPLVNLAGLVGEPEPSAGLALLVETGGQPLAFPVEAVLGFETRTPLTPAPQELLAEDTAGDLGTLHHLDLPALVQTLQAQLGLLTSA